MTRLLFRTAAGPLLDAAHELASGLLYLALRKRLGIVALERAVVEMERALSARGRWA